MSKFAFLDCIGMGRINPVTSNGHINSSENVIEADSFEQAFERLTGYPAHDFKDDEGKNNYLRMMANGVDADWVAWTIAKVG